MEKERVAYNKGYRISPEGVVTFNGRARKLLLNDKGYLFFNLRHEGRSLNVRAHRLQAFQKFGESMYNEGIVVRHLNAIRTDNRQDNIEIGTTHDNVMDQPKEIRIKRAKHAVTIRELKKRTAA